MKQLRVLFHLARADFLERSRRFSFLVTLLVIIFIAYAYLPPAGANGVTFNLGSYRGIYNSAWVGAIVAILCSTLLSLPGFFLVKNTIERDASTRVGQILATTPISRVQYVLGKLFSNFIFLSIMVGVIMAAGLVMQIVRGESLQIELWKFVAPFLFTTLPLMALVAAIAILFETISWLRVGFGNIVYLVLYLVAVTVSIIPSQTRNVYRELPEPFGLTVIAADMSQDVKAVYPDYDGGLVIGYTPLRNGIQTFEWDGVDWSLKTILMRMMWIGVAVGIALLSGLAFSRFDPALEGRRRRKKRPKADGMETEGEEEQGFVAIPEPLSATRLTLVARRDSNPLSLFFRTLAAELRLMLKGAGWWWYLIALAIILTEIFVPDEGWKIAYLIAWVWPVLIWSEAGCREKHYRTNELVFSAAHPLIRQLPATWLAGVIIALLMACGAAIHLLTAGNWHGLFALLAGAIFISSLALGMGILSGSSKFFQVTYLLLWYFGPLNKIPALDFMGISAESLAAGIPLYVFVASALLMLFAFVGRRWQLAR